MTANPPVPGGGRRSLTDPSRWWMKQASLEARAAGTVPPSVPSASPARLPHGLSLPRRALLALESLGTCPNLTFAIPLGCSRSAKLDSGQCWQFGQSSAQLLGLGKKSQAVPANFSEKYLEKRGGDLFKTQIHSSRVKSGNLHCY